MVVLEFHNSAAVEMGSDHRTRLRGGGLVVRAQAGPWGEGARGRMGSEVLPDRGDF